MQGVIERWRHRPGVLAFVVFAVSLVCYHVIFGKFFPTPGGMIGEDYSLAIPGYFDGLLWFKANHLFSVPWFTPSFCGGQPLFADPQSGYYSLPQWLFFILPPVTAIYLLWLLMATVGFWGFYLLARVLFKSPEPVAALAGVLFMFNGFLADRMLIGHVGFHGFALVPAVALLLAAPRELPVGPLRWGGNALLGGLLLAYWVQSGLGSIIVPSALAVLALALVYSLVGGDLKTFFVRALVAVLIALGLSLSKLSANFAFMSHFDRADYLLPGFTSVWEALRVALLSLTVPSEIVYTIAYPQLVNRQWPLAPHEWGFGVTVVPLLILSIAMLLLLRRVRAQRGPAFEGINGVKLGSFMALLVIVSVPIAINVYTPHWNAFLKSLPIIKNSSTLIRWFILYIPLVVVGVVVALTRLEALRSRATMIALASCVVVLFINGVSNRNYYLYTAADYDPTPATKAWRDLRGSNAVRPIHAIGKEVTDAQGKVLLKGNDLVFAGISQGTCNNPIFGYQLEFFPVAPLTYGSPRKTVGDGVLNMKNPACYLFPKENACKPGGHFKPSQAAQLDAFLRYRPWPFAISPRQAICNWVSMLSLGAAVLALALMLLWPLWRFARRHTGA